MEEMHNVENKEKNPNFPVIGINENNKKTVVSSISFFKLFRYATKTDYCLMIIGTLAAIINGSSLPLFALIFG